MLKLKLKIVNIWHVIGLMAFIAIFMICLWHAQYNRLFILGMTALLSVLVLLFFRMMIKIDYNIKIIPVMLFIYFLVLILMGYYLRVEPSWDFGTVYKEAVELIKAGETSISNIEYFLKYTNNQPYFFVLYILFSIAYKLGTTSFLAVGIIFNAIVIVLSLGIFYICLDKIWNKNIALFGLMLSFLCVGYIGYVPIFYTDTFPLPFMNLILLLYIVLFNHKDKKVTKDSFIALVIGILVALGFELKATVIILMIGILIHMLFTFDIKKFFIICLVICISFVGTVKGYSFVFKSTGLLQYTEEEYDKYNFPYTHWVMMGLGNPGGFDVNDKKYTESLSNKAERIDKNIEKIKERLHNYGVSGFIDHLIKKIDYTWNDGTYFSGELLSRKPINNNNILHSIMQEDGEYYNIYKFFTDSFHYTILIYIIISFISGIKEKEISFMSCIRLSVFGLFVFLLIWESKSKYLVNFIPLLYIIAIDGVYKLNMFCKKRSWNFGK